MRHRVSQWLFGLAIALTVANIAPAQLTPHTAPHTAPEADSDSKLPLNLTAPTLGGLQFWTDEFVYHDWRIQRNSSTGHCRLLDGENFRRAWGTYDECRRTFDELKKSERLPPMGPRVVIALHGLGHWRGGIPKLAERLRKEGQYEVLQMSYASTQADLESHAKSLAKVVSALDEAREINFVGHSLGNLVIRHYLFDETDETLGKRPDPRIKRIVMLGPPNQGARIAEQLSAIPFFTLVVGPSGKQLATGWSEVSKQLATPTCEFGILAGGRGDDRGLNPLLSGDDDLIVRVDETRLAGARDFRILPCYHRQLLGDAKVHEYTLRFLQRGYFESDESRQPLAGPGATPAKASATRP